MSRRSWLLSLLLFAVVAAAYAPSARFGFIYDDPVLFAETPVRRSLDEYVALFTRPHFSYLPYYRPVARLTFELQKLVHGARPGLFHLANALAAGALALAARAALRRPPFRVREPFAWLAAATFALLPVSSSTVYPPTGRETLLSTTLLLAATAAFARGGRVALGAATVAFATALLLHEQAIVLPALLVCVDLALGALRGTGEHERGLARRALRHLPFVLVAGLYLVVRARVLADAPAPRLAVLEHPTGPLLSVGYALVSIFAPTPGLRYEAPVEVWATAPRIALAAALTAALVVAAWWRRKELGRVPALCAAWFAIALAPSANLLVQETPFAERWLCLAAFAPVALLASTASAEDARGTGRRWTVLLATLVVTMGAFAVRRGLDHRDNRTFLSRWVASDPRSAQARSSLGALLHAEGAVDVAELHLRKAVELSPRFADAHSSLGALLLLQDRDAEAVPHLQLAVRLNPVQPLYRYNLGSALARSGDLAGGERHLVRALELAPDFAAARAALDEVLRRRAAAPGSDPGDDR